MKGSLVKIIYEEACRGPIFREAWTFNLRASAQSPKRDKTCLRS